MNEHPLCCDCDRCINGAGGLVLAGAGVVVPALADGGSWWAKLRARRREQLRKAHQRWQARYPDAARAAKRRNREKHGAKYNLTRNEKRKAARAAARRMQERTAA